MPPQSPDHNAHNGDCKVTLNCPYSCVARYCYPFPGSILLDGFRRGSVAEAQPSPMNFKITLSFFSAIPRGNGPFVRLRKLKTSSNVIYAYMHEPKVSPTSSPQLGPQKRAKSGASLEGFLRSRQKWASKGTEAKYREEAGSRTLLGGGVSPLWISNVADRDPYEYFVRHFKKNMEHKGHMNRVAGQRAEPATQLPWYSWNTAVCQIANPSLTCGRRYKARKYEAKVINLTGAPLRSSR